MMMGYLAFCVQNIAGHKKYACKFEGEFEGLHVLALHRYLEPKKWLHVLIRSSRGVKGKEILIFV